ncbi:MAG: DUF4332 domain-containing protein [Anaerolineae bacterium]|nr:DUF4332 domain-containing protein [Anaerolineae bacterium]
MAKLTTIEGVGESYAQKLQAAGIRGTDALLKKGSTAAGRKQIAAACEISEKLVLRWVNYCDLFRIKGIGGEFAELLEAAGVDTVPELAKRKPENLLTKMLAVNAEKALVRRTPTVQAVSDWVEQAKALPRVVNY